MHARAFVGGVNDVFRVYIYTHEAFIATGGVMQRWIIRFALFAA